MKNFNELAQQIYQQNKAVGWWDDPNRCMFQTLQLVSTEIAEATEGERKNLMDDHLPSRKMGEVELADALIRLLDMAGRYDWIYSPLLPPVALVHAAKNVAAMHMGCNIAISELALWIFEDCNNADVNLYYSQAVNSILFVAESQGYDIEGAMTEKLIYNQQRADHKRENRAKVGGKKF